MESLEAEHKKLKESVESLTNSKRELEIAWHHLDDLTSTHTQALATYGQLESVRIGLKELKLFHNTVKEIAVTELQNNALIMQNMSSRIPTQNQREQNHLRQISYLYSSSCSHV